MSDPIYRVQGADGTGPWKPGFSHCWVEDRDDLVNLIPWTQQFVVAAVKSAGRNMNLGCGCRTVEQLQRWFTPLEYQTLLEYGYRAVKMDCDVVLVESDIQLVFARRKPLFAQVIPFDLYAKELFQNRS